MMFCLQVVSPITYNNEYEFGWTGCSEVGNAGKRT